MELSEHEGPPPGRVVPVDEATRVGEARRAAAAMATALGFDDTGAGRVALVATELATNLARHAVGGQLVVQAADGPAVDLLAVDRGPGIADVPLALVDGYSSGGTSGTGLGAVRRQADAVDLYSRLAPYGGALYGGALYGGALYGGALYGGALYGGALYGGALYGGALYAETPPYGGRAATPPNGGAGEGTVVWARCVRAAAGSAPEPRSADVAGICVPVEGETACGDAWAAVDVGGRMLVLVADGLGHGPDAAAASMTAISTFRASAATLSPALLVERLHGALRATRGAAVAVAEFDGARREIRFAGVGNVAGAVLTPGAAGMGAWASHSMMSHNGTVGHQLRKVQELVYAWPVGSLVVFHTDGIRSRWQLDRYPGLGARRPALVAAVLWRDHSRGRDDATVVVVRDAPASGPDVRGGTGATTELGRRGA